MIFFHYHWDNILTQALNQKLPVCRCHIFFNKLIDLSVPKKYCIVGFVYFMLSKNFSNVQIFLYGMAVYYHNCVKT